MVLHLPTPPVPRVIDPKFGPNAQTPAQRAHVLAQLQATLPGLKTRATDAARQLYARYVAGELSWDEVRHARDAGRSGTGAGRSLAAASGGVRGSGDNGPSAQRG